MVTKLEAAKRQLETAIRMIFSGGDPVATHTLVGAASNILSDLIQHQFPDRSWDTQAQSANSLAPSDYFTIMRKAQNFLKHAKADPDGSFGLEFSDTDSLTFWAVMNLSELESPLPMPESVFQMWYLACYSPCIDDGSSINGTIRELFGDLRQRDRNERISVGARILAEHENNDV